jgi:hypothetical protein
VKTGHVERTAVLILVAALIASAAGEMERGVVLHAAADAAMERVGRVFEPLESGERQRDLAKLREAMGVAAFESAYNRGRRMTYDEAIVMAIAVSAVQE